MGVLPTGTMRRVDGLRQLLLEEVPGMAGWVVPQFRELFVTTTFVEAPRLEVVSVEVGHPRASPKRCGLDLVQEPGAEPLAAEVVSYPEMAHEQPAPVRVSGCAADQIADVVREHRQLPVILGWCDSGVPVHQPPHESLYHLRVGVFEHLENRRHADQCPTAQGTIGRVPNMRSQTSRNAGSEAVAMRPRWPSWKEIAVVAGEASTGFTARASRSGGRGDRSTA